MEAKVLRDFLKKTCQSVLDCNACVLNGIGVGLCCYGDATDEMIDKAITIAQNNGAQPAQAEQKCIFCGNICNDVSEAHYPYKKGRAHWHCIMNERPSYKPAPLAPLESRSSWVSVKEKLPEDSLSVLIFYDGHMSIGSYIKGQWFGIGNTYPINITHWMKPAPPVDK